MPWDVIVELKEAKRDLLICDKIRKMDDEK